MKTPYQYLVEPYGDRYNNVKDGLIVNTTMDETDFKYTNRIGKIIGLPAKGGPLKEGDKVIVHHNTFRKWFNVKGKLKDSSNFIKKGVFNVGLDMIYAYNRGEGWKTIEEYVFVKPILEVDNVFNPNQFKIQQGVIKFGNEVLEEQGVYQGDKVYFDQHSEYEFNIEGELLYKMNWYNVMCKL